MPPSVFRTKNNRSRRFMFGETGHWSLPRHYRVHPLSVRHALRRAALRPRHTKVTLLPWRVVCGTALAMLSACSASRLASRPREVVCPLCWRAVCR